MSYAMESPIAVRASESARAAFIRRTYAHLAGAILAFAAIEFLIFGLLPQQGLDDFMLNFAPQLQALQLAAGKQRERAGQLSPSEAMTILIHFHQSH